MEIRDQIAGSTDPAVQRLPLYRALGEILAVYIPSFGLGILSALILLHDPDQSVDQITGPVNALAEILQYVMQASVTVFGVGYFCQRRGVTLRQLFGRLSDPDAARSAASYAPIYPQPPSLVAPPWGSSAMPPVPQPPAPPAAPGGVLWPGYGHYSHYMAPHPPPLRGKGWQFSRSYFVSMAGVLGFLLSVIVYVAVTHTSTGAPSQGDSAYLVLTGVFVALAAGFGEEMLVTGLTVNALESAWCLGKRAWVIYLVAVCLRIPFHLYYGWAALGVVIFTVVNVWVYRRWRLLWPIVLAHATYDFVESIGATAPGVAGLLLLALGLATVVMVIVVVCIELSDRSARRRFDEFHAAALAAQAAYTAQQVVPPEMPPLEPPTGPTPA